MTALVAIVLSLFFLFLSQMIVFCIDYFYPPKMFGTRDDAGGFKKMEDVDDEVRKLEVLCTV